MFKFLDGKDGGVWMYPNQSIFLDLIILATKFPIAPASTVHSKNPLRNTQSQGRYRRVLILAHGTFRITCPINFFHCSYQHVFERRNKWLTKELGHSVRYTPQTSTAAMVWANSSLPPTPSTPNFPNKWTCLKPSKPCPRCNALAMCASYYGPPLSPAV